MYKRQVEGAAKDVSGEEGIVSTEVLAAASGEIAHDVLALRAARKCEREGGEGRLWRRHEDVGQTETVHISTPCAWRSITPFSPHRRKREHTEAVGWARESRVIKDRHKHDHSKFSAPTREEKRAQQGKESKQML